METAPIKVVFPFCAKDSLIAAQNMEWQAELGGMMPEVVLAYDHTASADWVARITMSAVKCYEKVSAFKYPNPPAGHWPPNWAFQESARHMAKQKNPWLWMEVDMIPLCKGWLARLQEAYDACGKPFFNPIIPDLGHANGTGVYPANTPDIIKSAMNEPHTAWDVNMKSEMLEHCADSMHVLFHAWTLFEGRLHPYNGGQEPTFQDAASLRLIPPTAVLMHRNKDGTLVKRLREQLKS